MVVIPRPRLSPSSQTGLHSRALRSFTLGWCLYLGAMVSPPAVEAAMPGGDDDVAVPSLALRGFADITFASEWHGQEFEGAGFSLGGLDLLFTSRLAADWFVLAEVMLGGHSHGHGPLDVERLQVKYAPLRLLEIVLGKIHTPLGYWNTAYHHGTWLQTSISRPEAVEFEHDGGILPTHSLGLELSGRADLGPIQIEYRALVTNGRGEKSEEVPINIHHGFSPAFGGQLKVRGDLVSGLEIGVATYIDEIPASHEIPGRDGRIGEIIGSGHVVYLNEPVELIVEGHYIRHEDRATKKIYSTYGLFGQVGVTFWRLTPFYRYDRVDFGDGDPYFEHLGNILSKHTGGLRFDPMSWAAVKLEYSYVENDGEFGHAIRANTSFTF